MLIRNNSYKGKILIPTPYVRNVSYFLHFFFLIYGHIFAGGNGYINDYPTGRFLRDAKLYEIGAGTSEIRRQLIGKALNSEYS